MKRRSQQRASNTGDRVRSGSGGPCRACGQPMQRWEHPPGWSPRQGAGYYAYWFQCLNAGCKVQQVTPREAFREAPVPAQGARTAPVAPKADTKPQPKVATDQQAPEVRVAFESLSVIIPDWDLPEGVRRTNDGRELPYAEMSATHLRWTRDKHVTFLADNDDLRDYDPETVAHAEDQIEAIDAELAKLGQRPLRKPVDWRRGPNPKKAPLVAKCTSRLKRDGIEWVQLDKHQGAALYASRLGILAFVDSHPGRVFFTSLRKEYEPEQIKDGLLYAMPHIWQAARRPGGPERLVRGQCKHARRRYLEREVRGENRRRRRRDRRGDPFQP